MPLFYKTAFVFFFNDTATTEIYTLSLHDALPISADSAMSRVDTPASSTRVMTTPTGAVRARAARHTDRKSTRLNSSHDQISYAVFCLKKKKIKPTRNQTQFLQEQHGSKPGLAEVQ